MRFPSWKDDPERRDPELGDVACQVSGEATGDEDVVRRAYVVVGVHETATGYRLLMERVEYGTLPESLNPDALWAFWNLPR